MFITDEDYKVVIGDAALRVVSQTDPDTRRSAEEEAMEEIAGYLRPKYDTEAVFQAVGTGRNRLIVMYTCDIALYNMISSQPQKIGAEVRRERYDKAITWLQGVSTGKIIPDLPKAKDEKGEDTVPFAFHSEKPLRHNW